MLDPKLLRHDIEKTAEKLATRQYTLDIQSFNELEAKRKTLQVAAESLLHERNSKSKLIGKAKAEGQDIEPLLAEIGDLGSKLDEAKLQLDAVQAELQEILLGIPNLPHESVPVGKNEDDNLETSRWGEPKHFDFTPKDHVELGELNN